MNKKTKVSTVYSFQLKYSVFTDLKLFLVHRSVYKLKVLEVNHTSIAGKKKNLMIVNNSIHVHYELNTLVFAQI